MAKTNKKAENAEAVVEAVSKTDEFFVKNRNLLIGIAAAILLIGAGSYCFYKFYWQSAVEEAKNQMVAAERSFAQGDW